MIIKTPSKINLHLEIINKRQDGYHNLTSVIQLIDLYDEMEFKLTKKEIKLTEGEPIEGNIVLKAAHLMSEVLDQDRGVEINLKKNIPMGGGMGGGSSNAAATIIVLNKIWDLNLDFNQLSEIALKLGSDVPFFLGCENAWVEGRGEILNKMELKKRWFLLFFPKIKISTKKAFDKITTFPRNPISKQEFEQGRSINSFTEIIQKEHKEIRNLVKKLQSYGIPKITGTGSTIYMEFNSLNEANEVKRKISMGLLTKSIEHSPLKALIE